MLTAAFTRWNMIHKSWSVRFQRKLNVLQTQTLQYLQRTRPGKVERFLKSNTHS